MQGRSWPLGAGMSNETLQSVRQGRHQCGRAISTLGWELRQQTEILATPNLLLIIVLRLSGLSWRRTRSVCFTAVAVCLHWAVDNQLYVCLFLFRLWPHESTNPNWRTCSNPSSITYQHWKYRVEQLGSQFDQPLFHFSSGLFSQSYVRQSERYPETPALLAKQWQNHFPQTSRCQKNSQFTT